MKFRKKPVVIEAFQMTEARRADNADWPQWLHMAWQLPNATGGAVYPENFPHSDGSDRLQIQTLEGIMTVEWNDWIIRGVSGELYPCKPDIFAKTYDVVDETVGHVTLESRYRAALATLVGVTDVKELTDMEVIVRLSGIPAEEKINILAAINLLIETAPKP
jgi:hypothetical protein